KFRKILSIADTFYNLNDIKINKDKSELLLRKKYIPESLSLSFGKSIVNIKPTSQTGSIRLLEVWFNAFNRRNHVIYQIKHKINNCCDSMMLRKKLTDKQMVYIFNVLIIPRIEYRAQLIILSEQECNKFMAKFRILFKHKLKFMKTTPNLIIHLKEMFNVKNIEDNQLQAKTTNFILQINDKNELGMITKIRLYNLQQFVLKSIKNQNFSIAINDTIDKMEIIGGNILIKDILPEEIYFKNLRSIKKLNIMFANQILTLDGKILLTLKEILGKRFKKFFSPNRSLIEKSWKIIEDCLLDNNEVIKRQISIEAKNK
ncbi:22818_t:CDS:2, partial [Rhizophagus irregularis]